MSAATSATVRNRSSASGRWSPVAGPEGMPDTAFARKGAGFPTGAPIRACTTAKRSGVTAARHGAGGTNLHRPFGLTEPGEKVGHQRRVMDGQDVVVQGNHDRHGSLLGSDEQCGVV